jgi:hypothetical protein
MWVGGKVILLPMLKDKDTLWLQEVVLEDQGRDVWQLWQGIWRVSKDKIKLLVA